MTNFEKAIENAENAVRLLNRVKSEPADEMSLLLAYGDLQSALMHCRRAFSDLGFDSVDAETVV